MKDHIIYLIIALILVFVLHFILGMSTLTINHIFGSSSCEVFTFEHIIHFCIPSWKMLAFVSISILIGAIVGFAMKRLSAFTFFNFFDKKWFKKSTNMLFYLCCVYLLFMILAVIYFAVTKDICS